MRAEVAFIFKTKPDVSLKDLHEFLNDTHKFRESCDERYGPGRIIVIVVTGDVLADVAVHGLPSATGASLLGAAREIARSLTETERRQLKEEL